MAKGRGDFTDILIRKKIIGSDQLTEAQNLLAAGYGIEHATLQVEAPQCATRCQALS